MRAYKETDMYEPIRNLLTRQGFTVRGEVKGCDIVAINGETMWAVEMKLSANITLIYQAMARQMATDWVFVAIPRPKNSKSGTFLKLKKLIKKLQLGLITVALDSPLRHAEVIIFPIGKDDKGNKKAAALKREVLGRTIDTIGGTTKTQINTAYRERCVRIACLLKANATLKPKELVKMGCEKDAGHILRSNNYGWFNKVSMGVYELSSLGVEYLNANAQDELVKFYTAPLA